MQSEVERRDNDILTIDDVAALLQVKHKWVVEHCSRYKPIIPHTRIGKKFVFLYGDIMAWIRSRTTTKAVWEKDEPMKKGPVRVARSMSQGELTQRVK